MTFHGLTSDHPRGYDALAEATRRVNAIREEPLIEWSVQPLEEFESKKVSDLAQNYDLLVIDHPHLGEALGDHCLTPMEAIFPPSLLATWADECVGPSFASYRWGSKQWALPLDVAAQVMVRRQVRLAVAPTSRNELEEVAATLPMAFVAKEAAVVFSVAPVSQYRREGDLRKNCWNTSHGLCGLKFKQSFSLSTAGSPPLARLGTTPSSMQTGADFINRRLNPLRERLYDHALTVFQRFQMRPLGGCGWRSNHEKIKPPR